MQVFKDEQNEIICYYDANGDLVCEGWDEGPHFQPDPQQPALRRSVSFSFYVFVCLLDLASAGKRLTHF